MFTKSQLELLEDILDTQGLEAVVHATQAELKELRGLVRAALWALPRTIPRKDRAAILAAEKAGLVQIVGRNTSPVSEPAIRIAGKPQRIAPKSGDDLLSILGLL